VTTLTKALNALTIRNATAKRRRKRFQVTSKLVASLVGYWGSEFQTAGPAAVHSSTGNTTEMQFSSDTRSMSYTHKAHNN